jgi:hypothetical protein
MIGRRNAKRTTAKEIILPLLLPEGLGAFQCRIASLWREFSVIMMIIIVRRGAGTTRRQPSVVRF